MSLSCVAASAKDVHPVRSVGTKRVVPAGVPLLSQSQHCPPSTANCGQRGANGQAVN
jgi:hypothetical protein